MIRIFINWIQKQRNLKNQKRLFNKDVSIISSNCTGGVLYHWLGLKFKSPFINLYMDNKDFLMALENFDEFIDGEVTEDKTSEFSYPVGIGIHGERIHFMHYTTFAEALKKWNERKKRINRDNIAIMLTNFGTGLTHKEIANCQNATITGGETIVKRFEQLPFKNKIILSGYDLNSPNHFKLKGYPDKKGYNIFRTKNILGQRYIDQFDYVEFFNKCQIK